MFQLLGLYLRPPGPVSGHVQRIFYHKSRVFSSPVGGRVHDRLGGPRFVEAPTLAPGASDSSPRREPGDHVTKIGVESRQGRLNAPGRSIVPAELRRSRGAANHGFAPVATFGRPRRAKPMGCPSPPEPCTLNPEPCPPHFALRPSCPVQSDHSAREASHGSAFRQHDRLHATRIAAAADRNKRTCPVLRCPVFSVMHRVGS